VVVASAGRSVRLAGGRLRRTPLLGRAALRERPLYLGLLAAEAGARLPAHEHERAAELVFLRAGRVRLALAAGRVVELAAGAALHLAPDARHELTVLERAQALQVFVPGGPEDATGATR
jgi:quercetin dioxygenase-like cupin family protein